MEPTEGVTHVEDDGVDAVMALWRLENEARRRRRSAEVADRVIDS
jgi:hypothetical protein